MKNSHSIKIKDVFNELKTTKMGLNENGVKSKLIKFGLNKIEEKPSKTPFQIFLSQFKSILIIVLIIAAVISFSLGELPNGIAISVIIILNSLLGFHQEYKAEKSIEALRKLIIPKVTVYRNKLPIELPANQLVPGDIIDIEEGNRIPADVRIFESINLKIDESTLTGESIPVKKTTEVLKMDIEIGDKTNMAFMGTLVQTGRGKGVVVNTGMKSELGKIASLIQEREKPTPLQIKLNKFGFNIGKITLIIAAIIFGMGYFLGLELFIIFLTSISLAVAIIPEGLAAVVALTLSIGTKKMLKKNVVVRKLASVEALGSATVICSDKTGTMTSNQITVEKIWTNGKIIDVTGIGFEPKGEFKIDNNIIDSTKNKNLQNIFRISKMCNNAILKNEDKWKIIGDPTEGALKVLSIKGKFNENFNRIYEIPFSSERKRMTTIHEINSEYFAFCKGAPEIILDNCKINNYEKEKIMKIIHNFAGNGMRVLGLAYKPIKKPFNDVEIEKGMIFVGLVGMIDPPREDIKESIKTCRNAGIRTMMLTGDHKLTAKSIANEIGINGDVITGIEIDKMSEEEFIDKVKYVNVFARISPEHKLRIVKILQNMGEIVAVTGDGVNDAPALKAAEIGIAMGIKGSDVSKESSEMILLDDNFSSIVGAIKEGRGIYDNIEKFIRYLLATNTGEVLFITIPIIFLFSPELLPTLLPVQLLWINLVTDGLPALSLGIDPKNKDIMKNRPHNPKETILKNNWSFVLIGGVAAFLVTFFAFMMFIDSGIDKARTISFSTLVIFELFFVFNCRSETKGIFRYNPINNKWLLIAIVASILLQLLIVQVEFFNQFLGTVPLELNEWLIVFGLGSLGFLLIPELINKIKNILIKNKRKIKIKFL